MHVFKNYRAMGYCAKKKETRFMGEMRLRAQHPIPKLNTVVNKTTTTTFMKSVMLFCFSFFTHSQVA